MNARTHFTEVGCPYCLNNARMTTGREVYADRPQLHDINVWYCDNGHEPAYVGCHRPNRGRGLTGTEPLGRLADAQLRYAKVMAHKAFDPLWQAESGCKLFRNRHAAYRWLANQLGIKTYDCHIGLFDLEQCDKVIELCKHAQQLAKPDLGETA